MSPLAERDIPMQRPHSSCRRVLRAPVRIALALVLLAGCGSSDGGGGSSSTPTATPVPTLTPTLHAGAFFAPVPFALSPDTGTDLGVPPAVAALQQGSTAGATGLPTFAHYFYLVNGTGIPSPAVDFTPNVLTVSAAAPFGAPWPNGTVTVSVEPFNAQATGRQLWKAVAGTQGGVFLRSAVSFEVDNDTTPNPLTGFGPAADALDLGSIAGGDPAIYWNQKASPTGDNSAFQQWVYDSTTAQLTNVASGAQLTDSGVGGGSAPGNQWYAFPNYYLEQVVAQPDSNPPFPTFPFPPPTAPGTPDPNATPAPAPDAAGEQAAYDYLSRLLYPGGTPPSCTINGVTYDGIRCAYSDLNNAALLSTCAATCLDQFLALPELPEGLPASVSVTDWAAVTWQIYQECLYASQVQTTFYAYNTIFTDVFLEDESKVPTLADDLGLSASQSVNVVVLDVIEGVLYTLLSATGDPAAGVFANLMSMGVNSALAEGGATSENLQQTIVTTVADLYSELGDALQVLTEESSNGQTAILQDWGRLRLVGPLTEIAGYNGLGLTADDEAAIQAAAAKGYSVTVMQQLLPLAYVLNVDVATPAQSYTDIPSYDQYSYSTWGTNYGSYNLGYLYELKRPSNYPSSQVMQTDIFDNGGNPWELFNAINGWRGLALSSQNFSCYGAVATVYNATPNDLVVIATAPQGLLAEAGGDFNAGGGDEQGTGGPVALPLPAYGYVPMFAATNGPNERNMTVNVEILDNTYSTENAVLSFTFGMDGCSGHAPLDIWNINFVDGYSYAPAFYSRTNSNYPQGMWVTVSKQ